MDSRMKPAFTTWPTICGCCRKVAMCVGYSPMPSRPVMWLCGQQQCTDLAEKVYHMKQRIHDECMDKARHAAAMSSVEYLQEIGKTDIWTLDADEHDSYMKRLLATYESALIKELSALAPY
jgi:hypothetical protein